MNQGEYSWVIDSNLLQKMLTAKHKQRFLSDVFQIGQLNWQISAYPNGEYLYQIGQFKIFIKLLTMPTSWQTIIINRRIYCKETKTGYTHIASYEMGASYGWPFGTLMLKQIQSMNPHKLTFTINITILQIKLANNSIFYENPIKLLKHSKFEWKINKELLIKMKNSDNRKEFESKIYDNCWCLGVASNGSIKRKDDFLLYLKLFGLPPNTMKISVNWRIKCKELNIASNDTHDFSYDNFYQYWRSGTLSFDKFKQFDQSSMTFCVEIVVLNIYDNDGIDIAQKNWDKYIQQNDEKKQQEISGNLISDDVQQKLDVQQARLNSLTAELEGMQNYGVLMEEMNNKITAMMTKLNELTQQTNSSYINTSKLQQQCDELVHIEEKKEENLCDNKLMMMQKITSLQQQFDELSKMQMNDIKNDKKENTEKEKLKSWFHDILGFPQYFNSFIDAGFDDLESMKHITMNDLDAIGITKLGHKKKIIREAEKLSLKQELQCMDRSQYHAQQQLMEPSVYSSDWICYNCHTSNSPNVELCKLCGVRHRNNNIKQEVEGTHDYDSMIQQNELYRYH